MSNTFISEIRELMKDRTSSKPIDRIVAEMELWHSAGHVVPASLHLLLARFSISRDMFTWGIRALGQSVLVDPYHIEIPTTLDVFWKRFAYHCTHRDLTPEELEELKTIIFHAEEEEIAGTRFYTLLTECYARHNLLAEAQSMQLKAYLSAQRPAA